MFSQVVSRPVATWMIAIAVAVCGTWVTMALVATGAAFALRLSGAAARWPAAVAAARVVAALGCLRAHGAYLPMDPKLPEQRPQHIVEASGALLVLVAGDWMRVLGVLGRDSWV